MYMMTQRLNTRSARPGRPIAPLSASCSLLRLCDKGSLRTRRAPPHSAIQSLPHLRF
ncbi:hypothetical protein BC567DRAFT_219882 [Phyllosticta citribraziliensis]